MLGFHNFTIALVYILCIASTVICVAWGAINWNRVVKIQLSQPKFLSGKKKRKNWKKTFN